MNRLVLIGLVLVVLGAIGLIVPRITWQEEAASVELGPLDVEVQEERSVPVPDLLAGGVLLVGVVLTAVGVSRSHR